METTFTCCMWMAQVVWDAKAILSKTTPSLEVVAHDSVHWKFVFGIVTDESKLDNFRMLSQLTQLHHGWATLTAVVTAMSYAEDELDCCMHVIPLDSVICLALCSMWNGWNAKPIILALYGSDINLRRSISAQETSLLSWNTQPTMIAWRALESIHWD